MMQALSGASAALIWALVTSAARSFLLAGAAAAGLAIFRPRATSLRLFTWTSVLYASLALPLLAGLLPPVGVGAPQFLGQRIASTQQGNGVGLPTVSSARPSAMSTSEAKVAEHRHRTVLSNQMSGRKSERAVGDRSLTWPRIAWSLVAGIYLTVMLFLLARFATGILWSSKLLRRSESITDRPTIARLYPHIGGNGPRLATSESILVPLTVGAFRATILLPSDWREWDAQKLHAVLAHELSHVARYDVLTQRLALLYRALFWFNPLAWWLHSHLAALAEQASDEAALAGGVDQKRYAGTLLDFFDALRTGPGRIRWQGVSMARVEQVERRLERILAWKGTVAMNMKRSLAAIILGLAVPVVYLAAAVRPAQQSPAVPEAARQPNVPSVAPGAPAALAPAAAPSAGVSSAPAAPPFGGIPVAPALAHAPSAAPVSPEPAIAEVAPVHPMALMGPAGSGGQYGRHHSSGTANGEGFFYSYGYDDDERFVIASGKADTFTMSGSSQDARHAEKLKKQIPGDFIWFQRDEKSYIIRDQATIDRAKALWAPQEELGRKQEELGKQQEELGKQQEELGAKMEQVKVNVPDMTAALDRLKAKLQKLGPTATMEQVGELQSEIGELQSKIGELQSEAGERQGKLGELQGELGEKQGKLGAQQGELGRKQAELAEKATREMKALLDEAVKKGTAKPEDEIVKNPTL